MANEIFELSNYDTETLKELLWKLCYNFKEFNTKFASPKEAINYVIKECNEKGINLELAGEDPIFDTMGIDLGIKNPVVRDIIIKRCYSAVFEEERCLEKIIKLLKTQDDGSQTSAKRIYGGLKEIGFCNEEANYLRDTCNLYPVGLLLERLWDYSKKHQINNSVDGSTAGIAVIEEKIVSIPNIDNPDTTKQSLFTILLQNEDSISKVINFFSVKEINSTEELDIKIHEAEEWLDSLLEIKEEILKLEQNGISGEYIATKKDAIGNLFIAKKAL